MSTLKVFHFQAHRGSSYVSSDTFVSASTVEDAWEILKKNAYQDCDVRKRYDFIGECNELAEGEPS